VVARSHGQGCALEGIRLYASGVRKLLGDACWAARLLRDRQAGWTYCVRSVCWLLEAAISVGAGAVGCVTRPRRWVQDV
jgi:hypothetical protein